MSRPFSIHEAMRIDKSLRLVFPVDTAGSGRIHVYSLPIRREIFEDYHEELAAVFNRCFASGPQDLALTGPNVAFAALKKHAKARPVRDGNAWDAKGGVRDGFINELVRLTSIAHATPTGWETLPLATARDREIVDDESEYEIMNSLVFFSAASTAGPQELLSEMMPILTESRGWARTSSTLTEYLDSLPKSTPEETSTEASPHSVIVS